MSFTPAELYGWALWLSISGFALWKGGGVEKIVGAALLLDLPATLLLEELRERLYMPQYRLLTLDVVLFAILCAVALRSPRRWPLWAAAYALLDILTHVAKIIDPSLRGWAYETTLVLWGYGELASLLVGTVQVVLARNRDRRSIEHGAVG